jgi:hypothetical protein
MSRHALTLSVSVSGAMSNHIYVDVQPATVIINNTLLKPQNNLTRPYSFDISRSVFGLCWYPISSTKS